MGLVGFWARLGSFCLCVGKGPGNAAFTWTLVTDNAGCAWATREPNAITAKRALSTSRAAIADKNTFLYMRYLPPRVHRFITQTRQDDENAEDGNNRWSLFSLLSC